ncbi:MAG: hypothetical protein ACOZCL_12405 [Bacillota bacterium]
MKDKQFNEWTRMREKGKLRFILKYGVLCWGTLTGILTGLLSNITDYGFTISFLSTAVFWVEIIGRIIFFQIGGILFGLVMWHTNESGWKKENSRRTTYIDRV